MTEPLREKHGHVVLPAIVVGALGESQLADGWHDRERDGRYGIPFRAAGERGVLHLRRTPGSRQLLLIVSGAASLAPGRRLDGRIIINSRKYELPLEIDNWVLRRYPIESSRAVLEVRLELANPPVPDRVLHNGDARRLGWFLSAIWQE